MRGRGIQSYKRDKDKGLLMKDVFEHPLDWAPMVCA